MRVAFYAIRICHVGLYTIFYLFTDLHKTLANKYVQLAFYSSWRWFTAWNIANKTQIVVQGMYYRAEDEPGGPRAGPKHKHLTVNNGPGRAITIRPYIQLLNEFKYRGQYIIYTFQRLNSSPFHHKS